MHLVPFDHDLVASKDASEGVRLKKFLGRALSKVVRAVPVCVRCELLYERAVLVICRISPEKIAKQTLAWYLLEPIYITIYHLDLAKLRAYPTMHREVFVSD